MNAKVTVMPHKILIIQNGQLVKNLAKHYRE